MKQLLIAAVVLAGLGGAIWWSEKQEAAKKELPDPNTAPKIVSINEAALKQFELQRAGEPPTIIATDDAGKWSMTAPSALKIDTAAVAAITSAATNLTSDHVVDENATDLAAYGLEPPVISIKMTMKDGKVTHLRIGGETPDKASTYTSVDGDKRLYVMPSSTKETFDKSANDLRDKHLLSFEAGQLSRVELNVSGKPPLEFSRSADAWQILKPRPLRADGLQVDEFVRQLSEAEMDTSAGEKQAAAAFGAGRPHATARLTTPSGLQTLEVRKSGDDYYARSSAVPGAFKVTPSLGTAVNKTLEDFQNKKLFDFAFDEPSKVQFKSKEEDKTFEKTGSDWLSNGRVMDSVGVQSLIDKLRDLAAARMEEDANMLTSEIEITVVSKAGSRTEILRLNPAGTDYLARRGNEVSIYRIDGSAITSLRQAVTGVQEAAPAATPAKK